MDKKMKVTRCYGCMKEKKEDGVCPYCGYDDRSQNEEHQLPAGTILREQYLVGRVLGQGGFGITYMGWDMYLDIPVAIKEYFPSGTVSRNCRNSTDVISGSGEIGVRFHNNKERFMREVKMLARMSDIPEIVQVKTFFLANNTAYIVMEYIEGMTLRDFVGKNGGRLKADEALNLLYPVMGALAKVHKAGLVHRDISPDNIMLQEDGSIKLLDFGAVRDVGIAAPDKPLSRSTEAILKQGYAPIEQYQSKGALGAWTDIYALCATIYYCLTGTVPADAPGRILGEEIAWFEELGIDVPEGLEEVLKQGMMLRVEERIQDMTELYEKLAAIVPVHAERYPAKGIKTVPDGKENPHGGQDDRKGAEDPGRKKWILAIALLGVIAAAAVIWNVYRSYSGNTKPPEPDTEWTESAGDSSETGDTGEEAGTEENAESSSLTEENTETANLTEENTETNSPTEENTETASLTEESTEQISETEAVSEDTGAQEANIVSGQCGGDVEYELNLDTGVITLTGEGDTYWYSGEPGSEAPWWDYRDSIKKLVITEGVEAIRNLTFTDCPNLTEVEGLEYVEEIGVDAFSWTGLEEVKLSENLKALEERAFEGCQLKEITIPASAIAVDMTALCVNPIEEITFEGDPFVTEEYGEFAGADHLIIYGQSGGEVERYCQQKGFLFVSTGEEAKEFPVSGQCGENVYWEMDLESGVLTLTGSGDTWDYGMYSEDSGYDWSRYTPEWMVYRRDITKVIFGEGITGIGCNLLWYCSEVTEIDWGTVEWIGQNAISNTALVSVEFPDTLKRLYEGSLSENMSLKEVILPESLEGMWFPFTGCYELEKLVFYGSPAISGAEETGSIFYESESFRQTAGFDNSQVTIYAHEGSTAQAYANEQGCRFEALPD